MICRLGLWSMFQVLNLLRMRSVQHGPSVCLIRSIIAAAMSINGSRSQMSVLAVHDPQPLSCSGGLR
jgi:hypothetical protein